VAGGKALRVIAAELHRAPSTISREVSRNSPNDALRRGRPYRDGVAQAKAEGRARRPKRAKLASDPQLAG
jgi:IS30 family transposase